MTETIEILNERLFPVDRETLFQTFADPNLLEKWWGPDGFTNAITAFDFRARGTWKLTMTASDGNEFHNVSTFRDVVVPERITFEHHEPIHVYTMAMDFIEEPEGTTLRWQMVFDATDELLDLKLFIHAANEQNFDRLGSLLEKLAS
ncbi:MULTISPECIES: SRPBCC domain-containing protein [unclassified Rhizobium]|uniref:SRPBCC domain-containing protein n=1 Tax=unclassified Rhizobium TaxID=2613769 RepID=UPI001783C58E|nr:MULTISPECIES: SRPBCC domain-containing protein [unclassified Rhizobium]MBD8686876.1 SRPBCC domain-containing protein [Rhizobium sp. CFBP 13644]MBD8691321.1 SRPBCC domain-containing protein [Rhizobium sp. CFBP 13717]